MTKDPPACRLLASGFRDDDVIAIAFRCLPHTSWHHRFVTARAARAARFQAWLRYLNAHGHDLYVGMNTFTPGVHARTEANVAAVRHVYVEFDDGGESALAAVRERPDLPEPSHIVHSSPGKFQVIWHVDGFAPPQAKLLLRYLAYSLGADRAVHDLNRVLRLPGFKNYKYDPPASVWLESSERPQRYSPDSFPVPPPADELYDGVAAHRPSRPAGTLSQSEHDWRFVCQALARGEHWRACVDHLVATRPEKSNPLAYATLTVLKALRAVQRQEPSELVAELHAAKLRQPLSRR